VLDAVGAENKDLANKKREAFSAYNRINTDALACQSKKVEELVNRTEKDIGEFSAKCNLIQNVCNKGSGDNLSLDDQLSSLRLAANFLNDRESTIPADSASSLQTGIDGLCSGAKPAALEKARAEAKIKELQAEKDALETQGASARASLGNTPADAATATRTFQVVDEKNREIERAKEELRAIDKKLTGEVSSASCVAIRSRIERGVKNLKAVDDAGRSLAGEAE
jgi:chromosome segregation ATPase